MIGFISMFFTKMLNLVLPLALVGAFFEGRVLAADSAAVGASKPATIDIANLFPDTVLAKGKGVEVKRSQLDDAMLSIKSSAAAQGQVIPPERLALLEQQVLDRLIQIQLLMTKANDADKTAGRETTAQRFEDIKTRVGGDEPLNRQLKAVGTTQDELRNKMIQESTAQAVLEREMGIKVSEADIKKFYEDNPAKFEQPETVRASHILLSTRDPAGTDLPDDKKAAKRKQAEDLLKRARAGEDFAKLAKENSEDSGSKDRGGEYTFSRGQMAPEFEAAAFSLKTNEVSDIVTTQYGYHIIKLSEKTPAKKVELAKVAANVKDYLAQEQMRKHQQDVEDYMSKLKKDSGIQILDESLKPKETSDAPPSAARPPADGSKKPEPK
jgi:parvulin-like peptidyl-prolyl isomerase